MIVPPLGAESSKVARARQGPRQSVRRSAGADVEGRTRRVVRPAKAARSSGTVAVRAISRTPLTRRSGTSERRRFVASDLRRCSSVACPSSQKVRSSLGPSPYRQARFTTSRSSRSTKVCAKPARSSTDTSLDWMLCSRASARRRQSFRDRPRRWALRRRRLPAVVRGRLR